VRSGSDRPGPPWTGGVVGRAGAIERLHVEDNLAVQQFLGECWRDAARKGRGVARIGGEGRYYRPGAWPARWASSARPPDRPCRSGPC
jgi:hypothetical protein